MQEKHIITRLDEWEDVLLEHLNFSVNLNIEKQFEEIILTLNGNQLKLA